MAHQVEQLAEGKVSLLCGDCLALLATLDANSVDACVTDPPYGLSFMGKAWDGCRVATEESITATRNVALGSSAGGVYGAANVPGVYQQQPNGRWPANVIHDGSDEVVGAFPDGCGQAGPEIRNRKTPKTDGIYGAFGEPSRDGVPHDTPGSAARFFYTAKADADDRLGSKHPTVKPLDLMQYLCRLVCPPKGIVLDPFAGTGTIGEAALREGMRAILIEREAEYQDDIRRRMRLATCGPNERSHEAIKAKTKGKPMDAGPLFGGTAEAVGGGQPMKYANGRSKSKYFVGLDLAGPSDRSD